MQVAKDKLSAKIITEIAKTIQFLIDNGLDEEPVKIQIEVSPDEYRDHSVMISSIENSLKQEGWKATKDYVPADGWLYYCLSRP